MTARDLIERLEEYPGDTVLYAFNGDEMEMMPVTGLLYTPGLESSHPLGLPEAGSLEFCTDEP
jgi:hypothetical protein